MMLMLSPVLTNALSSIESLITHGIVKLSWSFNYLGNLFWRIAEHSSLNIAIDTSPSFILFVRRYFKNFAYLGICTNSSTKGRSICNCLNKSMDLLNWSSVSFFYNQEGYGILGWYSFTIGFSTTLFLLISSSTSTGFPFSYFRPCSTLISTS